jgi:pyruvate dehydrogenase E2 component (dihydrolipoamide acetyltransferase)
MALNIYEFKFPDVGEGITEGKLVEWKVGVGDDIKVDQPLCSIETDKAVVDIPSPVTGKVTELLNKVNDTLIVGNVIITIDVGNDEKTIPESNKEEIKSNKEDEKEITTDEKSNKSEDLSNIDKPEKTQEQVTQKETSKEEIKTDENVKVVENYECKHINIKSMLSVRKYAKDNNIDLCRVEASGNQGQILMDDLTKAPQKKNSKEETKVEENIESPSETSKVETKIETKTNHVQAVEKERPIINNDGHQLSEKQDKIRNVVASPSVRQLALQKKLNITKITGSGENGRIIVEDINKYNPETPLEKNQEKEEIKPELIKTSGQTDIKVEENIENEIPEEISRSEQSLDDHHLNQTTKSLTLPYDIPMPYDNVRQIIADKMVESLQNTAQLTIFNKICIDDLVELRKKEKEILSEKGIKLTYLPFFIKAFIAAAKEYPTFNAISTKNSTIIKSDFNVGIAMDTPRGLLVPNVFQAQNKSIVKIAKDISSLVEKSKNSKITLDDMSNGTFTITSLGAKGGQFFTPILNYPQTSILGIGEISKQPTVKNDKIVIGNILHLSLTFDHRTVDGAEAAKFFNRYCELLKNVDLLLMEA